MKLHVRNQTMLSPLEIRIAKGEASAVEQAKYFESLNNGSEELPHELHEVRSLHATWLSD
jgi:hypothetical protein